MLLNVSRTNLEIHAKIQDSGVFHLTRSIRISKFFTILNFESLNNQRELEFDNFYTNVVCGYIGITMEFSNDKCVNIKWVSILVSKHVIQSRRVLHTQVHTRIDTRAAPRYPHNIDLQL